MDFGTWKQCCYNKHIKIWKWLCNLAVDRGWKNFQVPDIKNPDCFEEIFGSLDIKGAHGEDAERSNTVEESVYHFRFYIYMNIKEDSGEALEENEKHVIGH